MDTPTPTTEQKLLDDVLARLRGLGVEGEIIEREPKIGRAHYRPDALIRLKRGTDNALFTVEIKRGLRPGNVGGAIFQLQQHGDAAMLIADYVTPQLAVQLKAQNIAFADAAGNAYIERPNMLVWVKGEKPTEGAYALEQKGRAFQASGLRVLFALLCKPELINENYRTIAAEAGVAHGTVGWVMAELPDLGFLAEIAGKRRLLQPERLLRQWVEAYARKLRPKLLVGRYQRDEVTPPPTRHAGEMGFGPKHRFGGRAAATTEPNWQATFNPLEHEAVWGGEMAAAKMTNMLRPEITTLYVRQHKPALIRAARLRPDPNGNVELVTRFWEFENDPLDLAPPVLVYADLLATGDARCMEVAQELYGGIVARFGQ
jgi:hypothetical protein